MRVYLKMDAVRLNLEGTHPVLDDDCGGKLANTVVRLDAETKPYVEFENALALQMEALPEECFGSESEQARVIDHLEIKVLLPSPLRYGIYTTQGLFEKPAAIATVSQLASGTEIFITAKHLSDLQKLYFGITSGELRPNSGTELVPFTPEPLWVDLDLAHIAEHYDSECMKRSLVGNTVLVFINGKLVAETTIESIGGELYRPEVVEVRLKPFGIQGVAAASVLIAANAAGITTHAFHGIDGKTIWQSFGSKGRWASISMLAN